jgi:hypothetical protein
VEEAFEAKLTAINGPSNNASGSGRHEAPKGQPPNPDIAPPEAADDSELAHPEPRRLICGRTPADAHHLRFAQSRALGRKVSENGSSHSVEAIIARFIATVTNASGGQNSALTRTLPHEVCGYSLILRP